MPRAKNETGEAAATPKKKTVPVVYLAKDKKTLLRPDGSKAKAEVEAPSE